MSARSTWVAVAAAAAIGLASCSAGSDPGASDPDASADAEVVTANDEARDLFDGIGVDDPFCSAAVLEGDALVFAGAFGSVDGDPVTTETTVDIASVSKQFTGVAIELLIDRGDLSGSDLVGELVPASSPATDEVAVDDLLTHISGLPDYTDLLPEEYDEPTTQQQAIAAIAASEPTGTQGSFDYSNSNYVLLAEVVASVTGTSLVEFLDAEVFAPLDLDMGIELPGPWKQVGDGSIWTTPTELVTWSSEYWDQTLEGPDLATAMFDPEVSTSDEEDPTDETYGSGIMRGTDDDGTEWFFHDGSWGRYETDWTLVPDEQLAAAVTCDVDAELDSEEPARDLVELWRS